MVFKMLDRIEQVPSWMWIFSILCLNKLGFDLSGGEEQYLSYAKQFMDPEWIKNSFVYSEYAGSRIVFQLIVGFVLKWLSFEWTTFLFRLLNFLLYAHGFSLLFKKIGLSNLHIWFILQLYLVITQSFFSSAWMLNSFEPKTIAYAFSIYALYYYLDDKRLNCFLLLSVAGYFHILVTVWLAIYLLIHYLWSQRELLKSIKYGALFILLVTPLLYYIGLGILQVPAEELVSGKMVSANHIYAYYRLPHHLGLFKSIEYFQEVHLSGVCWMYVMMISLLLVQDRVNPTLSKMTNLSFIIATIISIFLIIAFIDHSICEDSGGFLLKSYPFRGNVWIKLFVVIILSKTGLELLKFGNRSKRFMILFLVICSATTTLETINNIKGSIRSINQPDLLLFSQYIHENTGTDSRFITYGFSEKERIPLGRILNREPYVEFKFVPAGTEKLYEWYRRCKIFDQFQIGGDTEILSPDNIEYIFSRAIRNFKNYQLETSMGNYYVYKQNPSNGYNPIKD